MNAHKKSYMTIISGSVKPVDYHPDARKPMTAVEQGHRKAVCWLISLAALIFLLVGVLYRHQSVAFLTVDTHRADFVAADAPTHVEVTIGGAIRAMSVRH
jgi:hypothetical protein